MGVRQFFAAQPKWRILLVGLILVAVIGYVDYLTGDYSILIFYLVPVSVVAWFSGRWTGAVIGICSGCARFISDYSLAGASHHLYWNSFEDMFFLLVFAFLINLLRAALERDDGAPT